jgi:glyoxylase-like metal-dependent hydrolase (beta-lactamase superfamily II)
MAAEAPGGAAGLGEELAPGLRRWTAFHAEWRRQVASVAVLAGEDLVLIDPLLEGDQWEALAALAGGRRLHVVPTTHWHVRSGGEVAARWPETRVWANSASRAAVARRAPVTDVFRSGDRLPAGLLSLAARPRGEVLLWEPRSRALISGDALLGDGERGSGLHCCPRSWLPASSTAEDLVTTLAPALELPVEMVLTSHGSPALTGARPALAAALAAS